jgi:nucleoside phosphorylase
VILVVAATELELGGVPSKARRLACGVGPVEAAAATAAALERERPGCVLHLGIAGATRASSIGVPQLVLGSEAVFCDLAQPFRLAPRRVTADAALLAAARRAFPDAPVRPIGTSARVGGTAGVEVEAMEGFGVLRAAQLAGVPALEVRAISNEIDEPDRGRWRLDEALAALAAAAPRLLEEVTAACV